MRVHLLILLMAGLLTATGCVAPRGQNVTQRQASVQDMRLAALEELHAEYPESRDKMALAAGYGVFRAMGTALLFGGVSNGYGVITDSRTGKDTYMRAFTGSAGLGFGIKEYRLVILFYDAAIMEHFITAGWDFGAQAGATMTSGTEGGEVTGTTSFTRSMDIYEFTKEGIFLRADLSATRFWPAKDLNID
jgi:hypothetical protein